MFSAGPDRTGPDLTIATPSLTDSCFLLDRTGPDRTGPHHCNTESDRQLFSVGPNRTASHHGNTESDRQLFPAGPNRTGSDLTIATPSQTVVFCWTEPDRTSPLQHRVRQTLVSCWTKPDRTSPLQHRVSLKATGSDRTDERRKRANVRTLDPY